MATYEFSLFPATSGIVPYDINVSANVVGVLQQPAVGIAQFEAIYDSNGTVTDISPNPPLVPISPSSNFAYGINNSNEIVGYSEALIGGGSTGGFVYDAGVVTFLAPPPALATLPNSPQGPFLALQTELVGLGMPLEVLPESISVAHGINDSGQIVGFFTGATTTHGYIYDAGTYTVLDDPLATLGTFAKGIDNSGHVVGDYVDGTGEHGFFYSGGSDGTYTTIDDPLATNGTIVNDINNSGQIVGSYFDATGEHGFLDSGGSFITVDDPGFSGTTVLTGISDTGKITGSVDSSGEDGFVFSGGAYNMLPAPSLGAIVKATGINNSGQTVGTTTADFGPTTGFLYSGGTFTNIIDPSAGTYTSVNGISNSGLIVGTFGASIASSTLLGFLDDHGTFTTIDDPNAPAVTIANGVNNSGQIVGEYIGADGSEHGFLLSGGVYTTVDHLGAASDGFSFSGLPGGTALSGINDAGEIVGSYGDGTATHGFLYANGTFSGIDDPLGTATIATGINNLGQIVGDYQDSDGNQHGFLYSNGTYTTVDNPLAEPGPFLSQLGTSLGGINDSGAIAGSFSGADTGFVAAPPPVPPTGLTLDPISDSGVQGDDITDQSVVVIDGSGTAGDTVTLSEGTTVLGTNTVDNSGNWGITASPLSDGSHQLTATQTDADGNTSDPSAPLTVTIDTAPPPAPTSLALDPSTDTGTLGDGITAFTQPVIDGQGEIGDTVTLSDSATTVGTATVDGNGAWQITASTLALGAHSLTASETDVAGNASGASAPLALTIEPPPVGPSGPNQFFYSGQNNQFIVGTSGADSVWTNAGGDVFNGLGGDDFLGASGNGNDFDGGDGNDTVVGVGSNDTLSGGNGDDVLVVSGDNSLADGGADNDAIWGSGSGDTISGGAGDDQLGFSGSNSLIDGGTGNNTIFLSGSGDTVTGGGGSNTIYFGGANNVLTDGPAVFNDTITGFDQVAGDRIHLTSDTSADALAHSTPINGGRDTQISLSDGSTIVLKWVSHIDGSFFS